MHALNDIEYKGVHWYLYLFHTHDEAKRLSILISNYKWLYSMQIQTFQNFKIAT
jgi:hypothetical protein